MENQYPATALLNCMLLFKKTGPLREWLQHSRQNGNRIGFVPTMGALHAGHLALVAASKEDSAFTVASIFVNPAQFNDKADFEKYPITIEKDIEQLEAAGCDALFWPAVEEIYPSGYEQKQKHYPLGYLETVLEGEYRPGHFQGVCMVMDRLLTLVQPQDLYMGQKDYQQCMVVQRLLEIMGDTQISLHVCPTLREADGLAMSSRNVRLNHEQRGHAVAMSQTLRYLKEKVKPGNLEKWIHIGEQMLAAAEFKTDYLAIADARTLELLDEWDGQRKIVALAAAFQDKVRLIDNMLLN